MICLGASVPQSFACLLKNLNRPQLEGVRWVADENLFVGFQNFHKKKPHLDLKTIAPKLRDKVYYSFFPVSAQVFNIEFLPNKTTPNCIKIKLDLKNTRLRSVHIIEQAKALTQGLKEVLKDTSTAFQTYDCDLQITLAHISPKALTNPDFYTEMAKLKLEDPLEEPFFLDKLAMVEVYKENSELIYKYYPVE